MSAEPVFSILMAAYGTENEIEEAIQSVLGQSRPDWELIVVDDGSPDDLAERVEPFLSDPRVELIRQDNRGAGAARNAAAARSNGRYLVVFDSDDRLEPEYLGSMGSYLDAHPEVHVVSCDARVFDARTQRVRRESYYAGGAPRPPEDRQFEALITGTFVSPGSMVRRATFESVGGFDTDRDVLEDMDLWLRIARSGGRFALLPDRLLTYRIRAGGISHDESGRLRLDPLRVVTLRKLLSAPDLNGEPRRLARERLSRLERKVLFDRSKAAARERRLGSALLFAARGTVRRLRAL